MGQIPPGSQKSTKTSSNPGPPRIEPKAQRPIMFIFYLENLQMTLYSDITLNIGIRK